MMRLFFHVVAALALVTDSIALPCVQYGAPVGFPDNKTPFSTIGASTNGMRLFCVYTRFGKRLDAIAVRYKDASPYPYVYGGDGGRYAEFCIDDNEIIQNVTIRSNSKAIVYLRLDTSLSRVLVLGTPRAEEDLVFSAPDDMELNGFYGYKNHEVKSLGVIWSTCGCQENGYGGYVPGTVHD
ncbi:unnamed protein product [Peronospora belbahrii]|uniref:Jacalin-type lectin domain-containing protein n=1 Tax=Peronospora belbahrii TaxID=622444 RepID=A0AAU9KZA6_9STRA|nr:unnamed protein product [Peronospora belbahrii]CAH0514607.1 unnamed protein product [Peronospora belbahrii]